MKNSQPMRPDMKISNCELAYIAGFFDGEGYVGIARKRQHNGKSDSYVVRTTLTNTDRDVLIWVLNRFGGSIRQARPKPKRQPCFCLHITAKASILFLRKILPFLRIKKGRANLAIEFYEKCVKPASNKRGIRLTSEQIFKRENYRVDIKKMNRPDVGNSAPILSGVTEACVATNGHILPSPEQPGNGR